MYLKIYTTLTFIVLALIGHTIAGDPYALQNMTYSTDSGYYNNIPVKIYGFDAYKTTTALAISRVNPIYVFLQNPNGNIDNAMQPSIVDLIPGDDGYSDLKRINIVTGSTNSSGDITSYDDLTKLGNSVEIVQTDTYYNLPVVGFSATLETPSDGPEMFGYYKGVRVRFFNFGINPAGNATAPIYHVTSSNGTIIAALPGTIPGFRNYSGIWNIYTISANDTGVPITSLSQVSNLEQVFSGTVSNCPVSVASLPRSSTSNSRNSRNSAKSSRK
ncbi:6419_t:CDS:2 [Cetraspora pellucida]|uniref:6419_t:CDS:1 n=1 Tax=Cetraspora pellucida TaxID=1433469 RepID=A0A9N8W7R0_9GLOM|nr:6419_t:CDS:2 [Cetraspora pellucida]